MGACKILLRVGYTNNNDNTPNAVLYVQCQFLVLAVALRQPDREETYDECCH